MEDKLPKKWFIRQEPHTYKIINDWLNAGCGRSGNASRYEAESSYIYYPNTRYDKNKRLFDYGNHCFPGKRIESGDKYTEITFEQFEKYVLNKQPESVINNNYEIF